MGKKIGFYLGILILFTSPLLIYMVMLMFWEQKKAIADGIFLEVVLPIFFSLNIGNVISILLNKRKTGNLKKEFIRYLFFSLIYLLILIGFSFVDISIEKVPTTFYITLLFIILGGIFLGIVFSDTTGEQINTTGEQIEFNERIEENNNYEALPQTIQHELNQKNEIIQRYQRILNSIQDIINN